MSEVKDEPTAPPAFGTSQNPHTEFHHNSNTVRDQESRTPSSGSVAGSGFFESATSDAQRCLQDSTVPNSRNNFELENIETNSLANAAPPSNNAFRSSGPNFSPCREDANASQVKAFEPAEPNLSKAISSGASDFKQRAAKQCKYQGIQSVSCSKCAYLKT